MSTSKVASVGLVLKNQGFIAASRDAKGKFVKDVGEMKAATSTLDAAITKTKKTSADAGKAMSAAMAAPPSGGGIFGWLRTLEAKSISTAEKIGAAFKQAFGAEGKGAKGGQWGAGALIAYEQMKKLVAFAKDTTREVNATHEAAVQLSVNARKGGGAYIGGGQLEAQAYATAADVKGTTADQALEAMSAFVTLTGDIKTAQSSITTFAVASKASGADMKDVAESVASISKQFGIVDPKQIKDVLAAMIYQGKEGAIMLPDLARGLQKIAAAGAAFGVSKDVGGVEKLGGLVQMARGGTGSAEQAFTAVEAVFRGLTEKGKELKAQHVNVYEGKGANKHTRSIDDILVDVVSKAGGRDIAKKNAAISEIFGSEGMRAISPMIGIYQTAFSKAGGSDKERTAAGVAALREALGGLVHAAGEWTDVMDDAAKVQGDSSAKATAAWEAFKGKMAAGVLPALGRLVDKLDEGDLGVDTLVNSFEMLVDVMGGFADFLKKTGLIKEKSSFEKGVAAQAKTQRLDEEIAGLTGKGQLGAKDQLKLERLKEKRKASFDEELLYRTKSEAEGTPADTLLRAMPETYGGLGYTAKQLEAMGILKGKVEGGQALPGGFREQYLEKQRAAGAQVSSPWAGGKVNIENPIKIGGVQSPLPIRIVGDDTKRGAGAAAPMPGTASRG